MTNNLCPQRNFQGAQIIYMSNAHTCNYNIAHDN